MALRPEAKLVEARLGVVIVASAPIDFSPRNLDWTRWILNTSVKFSRFEKTPPKRIVLLDAKGVQLEPMQGAGLEFSRRDLQSIDPLSLFENQGLGVLNISHGSWLFSLSSWVESTLTIATALHSHKFKSFLEDQFAFWKIISGRHFDDSYFVLSDLGSKFINAAGICKNWTDRISRSRIVHENSKGAWCGGIMQQFEASSSTGTPLKIKRLFQLGPRDWCGNPNWGATISGALESDLKGIAEIWISVPGSGITLEIFNQLNKSGLPTKIRLLAPSVVVGWHPIRDFLLCVGADNERIFVYLDNLENLHFISISNVRA